MTTPTIKYKFKIDAVNDSAIYFYTDKDFIEKIESVISKLGLLKITEGVKDRYGLNFDPRFNKNEIIAYMRKLETESEVK